MDQSLKQEFIRKWETYFGKKAELPIVFWYSNEKLQEEEIRPKQWMCIMGQLSRIRKGKSLSFDAESLSCGGGNAYCGFSKLRPGLADFLSVGKERYLQTPELAQKAIEQFPLYAAPQKYISFKRWDLLREEDQPEVVIFLATPDVLSGLFTLGNFDQADIRNTISPFSSGCGTIITFPYQQSKTENPKAVIGMFDPSARPYVPENTISFAVPMSKFKSMIKNMDESFLITEDWQRIRKRMDS